MTRRCPCEGRRVRSTNLDDRRAWTLAFRSVAGTVAGGSAELALPLIVAELLGCLWL